MRNKYSSATIGWLVYVVLYASIVLLQAFYTRQSMGFISHEELAESVRNVWWLHNRTIYDGISSNVGWYALVQLAYEVFGFSLFTGKILRLILFAIGLLCSFDLLLKYLGKKWAWLPILLTGLSPTLLYFTTLQTSFGVDVPYFVIVVWLLVKFSQTGKLWVAALLGFVICLASLSYPSFLLYLPALGILFVMCLRQHKQKLGRSILFVLGLVLPLLTLLWYLADPSKLVFDPQVRSGIFRGGGTFPNSWNEVVANERAGLLVLYNDLFILPQSYYFNAARSEFSHLATRLSVLSILVLAGREFILLLLKKKYAAVLMPALSFLSLLIGSLLASLSSWFPGLRRATIVLVAFYLLVIWLLKLLGKKKLGRVSSLVLVAASLVILTHHLKVMPASYAQLSKPNANSEVACFTISGATPTASLARMRTHLQANSRLDLSSIPNASECRLSEVYAAVTADCYWNNLNCPEILWYDKDQNMPIELETELWDSYYFAH
ncbi:MAG: hypothetical protein A2632_01450 [Candidatus Pacebacteria bacterium RIFCSPHIGHO2_01_FULL_46_16]|nr:MAG: hypothetical protein A2632_01450 [Candidatus Pacebacteria bacterium RIFCSPHIGHO2_01_FULL_46_16]OGJ20145.1 MAG: hypothetical protein A3J60_03915 [Candidatus Pacebacteria bacterium RIFCSPHIGHO2_02_FULL_46_9]